MSSNYMEGVSLEEGYTHPILRAISPKTLNMSGHQVVSGFDYAMDTVTFYERGFSVEISLLGKRWQQEKTDIDTNAPEKTSAPC
jgi:hypothetical protein